MLAFSQAFCASIALKPGGNGRKLEYFSEGVNVATGADDEPARPTTGIISHPAAA
jgi:hypothetical protein